MLKFRFALLCMTVLAVSACGGETATGDTTPIGTSSGGGGGGSGGSGSGSSGSGSAAFYLPFVATSTGGGETGLFVVPSDNLSSTPIFVTRTTATSQNVSVMGLSKQLSSSSTNVVTASSPYALIYAAVGSDGNAHIYALNLSNTSVAPGATQVSSLALSSMADICSIIGTAQTNVADPTTMFVVLHTNAGGASSCGAGGDVYQVVHYNDSAATDPAIVNITPSMTQPGDTLTALYQSSGALGGLVLLDSATGNLDFYSDDTFTSPKVLTGGVSSWADMVDDSTVDNTGAVGATTAFLSVTTSSGTFVWRVTASGAAANVYTASGTLSVLGVADTNSVYFTDNALPVGTQTIYQEAIAGGTPLTLYSTTATGLPPPSPYFLVGSNGKSLVLTVNSASTSGDVSTSVLTLPVGTPGTPTTIAGPFPGLVSASMCPATFGDGTSDDLLVNVTQGMPGNSPTRYSSEVLTPSGAVKQAVTANSAFLTTPNCGGGFGAVLQVRGITDTSGGFGGATANAFNLGSFSTTTLSTTTGSGTYTVPSGDQLLVTFLSANIGLGVVGPQPDGTSSPAGVAVDLSKSLIVTVSVPSSTVSLLL